MSLDVNASIVIHRDRSQVARYAMEPANDPVWIGGIAKARPLTESPIGVGSRVERVAEFMGRRIEYLMEVVRFEPDALLEMHSRISPFPMQVTYRFEDTDRWTRAHIRVQGSSSGFYKLRDVLMAPMVKRNINADLKRLKSILESTPAH